MKTDADFARDERMTCLIADLTRISTAWGAQSRMLEDCPLLEQWQWTTYPDPADPALAGIVTGHPLPETGRAIVTSPVLAFGVSGNSVRPEPRLYRLRRSHADG